ncbi:MAG: phosphatidate cytidylyltransferase [Minwuia sp.]|uniref:phosphatidate cytidylyltransferase n=1 Tax=Minwuia sp. TaxID=2493630 RepID=UPI003A85319A
MADREPRRQVIVSRVFSAVVLASAALVATLAGGLAYLALILVFAALVHWELHRITRAPAMPWSFGVLAVCWAVAVLAWYGEVNTAWAVIPVAMAVALMTVIWRGGSPGWAIAGSFYVALPCAALGAIRLPGAEPVIWLFVVVWATDTGAYLVGRKVGGPKLWLRVSPGKTWSGAVGGLVIGTASGVGLMAWIGATPPGAGLVLLSAVLSVAAQLGDLLESAGKRAFNVKDSGSIIPGHGGVMDRLDSVIGAAVVLFMLQSFAGVSI